MFKGKLSDWRKMIAGNEWLTAGFEYVEKNQKGGLAPGRHEIDGKQLFADFNVYATKDIEAGCFEGHNYHVDIQYVVSGEEQMAMLPLPELKKKGDYLADKDAQLYHLPEDRSKIKLFTLKEGEFAVFFPEDGHMGGRNPVSGKSTDMVKIVAKVRIPGK